LLTTFLQFFFY